MRSRRALRGVAAAAVAGVVMGPHGSAEAEPTLPDLVSHASVPLNYMYGGFFDTTSEPGRVLYRFNTAITNLGDGPFEIFEITDETAQTQEVFQNLYDSDGSFEYVSMGTFPLTDSPFGHLHLAALAQYNLREVLPDEGAGPGVGGVVASFAKTSHAVVDSVAIDNSLPNAPSFPVYRNVNINPLGISVGYADLYSTTIPTQRIDVTGIASGQYWLEVTVDPLGYVQETDDTNNTTRILVDLAVPVGAATVPGDYDNSGQVDQGDLDLVLQNWGLDVDATAIPNAWVNDRPDGLVDQAELDGVLSNWGDALAPEFGGAAVPEPVGVGLLAGLGAARRKRTVIAPTNE